MKAAIYNPYWNTLGGGERYMASFAKVLLDNGYQVDIEWKNGGILDHIENRFGIKTDGLKVVDNIKKGEGYDLCFWVSDGSIPLLHSRKNILHFQVPFTNVNGDSLLNRMKLYRVKKVVCNSNFTIKIIDKEYRVNSLVIYPPCDTAKIKPKRKENIILSVGRFSQLLQSKHQDVLVEVFIKLFKRGLTDWKLVLAGGSDVGARKFIGLLKRSAHGYPIEIRESIPYKNIIELYGISKIFWTASGYGVDESKNPEKVEHFGISTVEAMSGGCVPLVYAAGGLKEIVDENKNLLWVKKSELMKKTLKLIDDGRGMKLLAKNMVEKSKAYGYDIFKENVEKILQ